MAARIPGHEVKVNQGSREQNNGSMAAVGTALDVFQDSGKKHPSAALLLQHVQARDVDQAHQIIEDLFHANQNLKTKDLIAELRKAGQEGGVLADYINLKLGTGFGRTVSRKTPTQRIKDLKDIVDEFIKSKQHPAAMPVALAVPMPQLPEFNTPAIQEANQVLQTKKTELDNVSKQLTKAQASADALKTQLKAPEKTFSEAKSQLKNLQLALERFNIVRAMSPAERVEQKSAKDPEWNKILDVYAARMVAKSEKAKEAAEFLADPNQHLENLENIRTGIRQYLNYARIELAKHFYDLHPSNLESELIRADLETLEYNLANKTLKQAKFDSSFKKILEQLKVEGQFEALQKDIASNEYELELVEAVIAQNEVITQQEEVMQVLNDAHEEAVSEIKKLTENQNRLKEEIKDAQQKLNWQGYQVRAKAIQDTSNTVYKLNSELKNLTAELQNDAQTNLILPKAKQDKSTRISEIQSELQIKHTEFRTLLIELERYDSEVAFTYVQQYPEDQKPYPEDPIKYTETDWKNILTSFSADNPLFTGGENYRPSIHVLVRNYQLARQGMTLLDAYQALFEKLKSAAFSVPEELNKYNKKETTSFEKMMMLSSLLGNNFASMKNLYQYYPWGLIEAAGNIAHASTILNKIVVVATGQEAWISQLKKDYQAVSVTTAVENVVTDVVLGHTNPFYSTGELKEIDPTMLAALDFTKYLPYLAALLVSNTATYMAEHTGARLLAETAAATALGVMSKKQAFTLVAIDTLKGFLPSWPKTVLQQTVGAYNQVQAEQRTKAWLRYNSEVKGRRIFQALGGVSDYEQAIRNAAFYGQSKERLKTLGDFLRTVVEKRLAKDKIAIMAKDWFGAWKQSPGTKTLKYTISGAAAVGAVLLTGGGAAAIPAGVAAFSVMNKGVNLLHDATRSQASKTLKKGRMLTDRAACLKDAFEAVQNLANVRVIELSDRDFEDLGEAKDIDEALKNKFDTANLERKQQLAKQAGVSLEEYQAAEAALVKGVVS